MTKSEISEYYSDDRTKKTVVIKYNTDYSIDFYENDKYFHSIMYTDKSLRYVEDAAENYALGIFKSIRDF
jgi:hypothetical protein